jgi:hypothetical protein
MRDVLLVAAAIALGLALGTWLAECNRSVRTERVVLRDTVVVRDTVRITIPARVINSQLRAKKITQSSVVTYRADTTLGDGVTMLIEFVPDSLIFDVAVHVPARDTAVPRTVVVERTLQAELPTREREGSTVTAFLAGVLVGIVAVLLIAR